jgi:Protein of unknown function (DUF642)
LKTTLPPQPGHSLSSPVIPSLALFILLLFSATVPAADFSATWLGSDNAAWSDGTAWSTAPAYPNNGPSGTYDATIGSGTAFVDNNFTIQRLHLSNGIVHCFAARSLTLNDGIDWSGGMISAGTINLSSGSSSTISSNVAVHGSQINNSGSVYQTGDISIPASEHGVINNLAGASWNIQNHMITVGTLDPPQQSASFTNAGNFTAVDSAVAGGINSFAGTVNIQSNIGTEIAFDGSPIYHGLTLTGGGYLAGELDIASNAALILGHTNDNRFAYYYILADGITINGPGTLVTSDDTAFVGNATVNANLIAHGEIEVWSQATLTLNGVSHIAGGFMYGFGGTVKTPNYPLTVDLYGALSGFETVDGDVAIIGGEISPSKGTLSINGKLTLDYVYPSTSSPVAATLAFTLFGPQYGNGHLLTTGSIELNKATLILHTFDDFDSQLSSNETYSIAHANGGVVGTFANFANGQRLSTTDGKIWCQLNYGPDSAYDPNDLLLSHPITSLLQNGNFASGPTGTVGSILGWNVIGNVAEVTDEGWTSAYACAALSRGGNSQGDVLAQSFNTTPGQTYALDFEAGIIGIPAGALQLRVQLLGNGSLVDDTQVLPVANSFDPKAVKFSHYHYTFTANSSTTTLQFSDIGLGNAGADQLVDDVVVGPPLPTPPPTTLPLRNRNFESPAYDGLGEVTGWTVSGNGKINAAAEGATSGTHSAAFSVTGDSQGNILSQRFFTVPGGVYYLDFDAGISGKPTGGPLQLRAQVIGSGTILDHILTPPNANTFEASQVVFRHYRFTFTANSTVTTLQFSDIGTGNAAADVVLDTVSVAPRITAAINLVSDAQASKSIVHISGTFLPGAAVKILESLDLTTYSEVADVQCDADGFFSSSIDIPSNSRAAFFKVTDP